MPRIRNISIRNYRTLKAFCWNPSPGLNCIIGPGDAGKTTILDCIDIALGLRRNPTFSDSDFFESNTSVPIEILVTVGDLPDELKNIESYGLFLRGFNLDSHTLHDEPEEDCETVLTVKVTVSSDLDVDWRLYSDRAAQESYERRLPWKHRELISAARLGTTSQYHLSWGGRSVLNKFSGQSLDVASVFAEISRNARAAFAEQQDDSVATVLNSVKEIADSLGVELGELKAQLDTKGISLSSGAVALHNDDDTPLRQLGTGSTRLLISGLHKAASDAGILLVDEAEYGLEPYRITRLLHELGSKQDEPGKQVFITTHSPYVIRELQAKQLCVLRPVSDDGDSTHFMYVPGDGEADQATLRACTEGFLSKKVVVCEGKTEIGLVRGIDQFNQEQNARSISASGTFCTDGLGDNMFARSAVFADLGYRVALFKDSDKVEEHAVLEETLAAKGVPIYQWGLGQALEDALFTYTPAELVPALLSIAVDWKSHDSVNAVIMNETSQEYGIDQCLTAFQDEMRPILAAAAKSKSWYKDIEPAERIGREILGPNYSQFPDEITSVLNALFQFAHAAGNA